MAFATAELIIDGVSVAEAQGQIFDSFSVATILLGQGSATGPDSSRYYYDLATIIRDGVNLVDDSSFESGSAAGGTGYSPNGWSVYSQGGGTTASFSGAQVLDGSLAARVDVPGLTGGYFLQDIEQLATGDRFDFDVGVFRDYGTQAMQLLFDWDRSQARGGDAAVVFETGRTTFNAWGLTGEAGPISTDEWHRVILRLYSEAGGFMVGKVGVGRGAGGLT